MAEKKMEHLVNLRVAKGSTWFESWTRFVVKLDTLLVGLCISGNDAPARSYFHLNPCFIKANWQLEEGLNTSPLTNYCEWQKCHLGWFSVLLRFFNRTLLLLLWELDKYSSLQMKLLPVYEALWSDLLMYSTV